MNIPDSFGDPHWAARPEKAHVWKLHESTREADGINNVGIVQAY